MWQRQLDFQCDASLDRVLEIVLKKSQKSKKPTRKRGRPGTINPDELSTRYQSLKWFLEYNWGRIGLKLQRVRTPEDVRVALRLVPGVEWYTAFRDHKAVCLLADGDVVVEKRELDLTRRQHKSARDIKERLWSEYHSAFQKAEAATTALRATISQFEALLSFYPFAIVIFLTAKFLDVEKLTYESNRLKHALDLAQQKEQLLKKKLDCKSAWFARNEVVRFRKSRRFEKSATNFASAMAGLPEYGWLHSFRKCSMIQDNFPTATSYLLFEILRKLVKRAKRLDVLKIEMRLRDQLLQETDIFVKGLAGPNWAYMRQAFTECRGKGFSRTELPYEIFGRFLYHLERPKTLPETELAKREQLVYY